MGDACHKSIMAQQIWHLLLTPCAVRKVIYVGSPSYCLPVLGNHSQCVKLLNGTANPQYRLKLAFQPIALIDTQSASPPSQFQETASTDWEMAYLSSHAQATPLADLEAADVPHESSRNHSGPPSYVEENMAEPLPSCVNSIRRKMKHVIPYSNNGMPSKPVRFWLAVSLALVLLSVIAIPIAVARN